MADTLAVPTLEDVRMAKVLTMLPDSISNVLEIGARHGVMTQKLVQQFGSVTALDLRMPRFDLAGVTKVEGNVEKLQFDDNAFDCIVCTEVLEHVPDVVSAARELYRVSSGWVLVGVPFQQDTRVGRTTCLACGRINPPYGHVNSFDEGRIARLFPDMIPAKVEYLAENRERTNALSVWLQDFAGNPYGSYDQEEPCIYCDNKLVRPGSLSFVQRAAASVGVRLYDLQVKWNRPQATWILMLLQKVQEPSPSM